MDTLVLPVVVLGFFSCFLLLFFRGARIERHLAELTRLVTLDRARPSADGSAAAVAALLESIRDLDRRIESHLEGLVALQSKSKLAEARDVVERKLHLQGYSDPRLRIESGEDDGARRRSGADTIDTRFSVEVSRRGVEYKGYAVVRDGVIVDSSLNPVYATFP